MWRLAGDPTEGALVTFAVKAGLDADAERRAWPRKDEIPFESEHRFMATLNHDHHGHAVVYLKGAPERVLELCRGEGGAALDSARWAARLEAAAGRANGCSVSRPGAWRMAATACPSTTSGGNSRSSGSWA